MARFDWDRLRRNRPMDGAELRVDADGAHVWERTGEVPRGKDSRLFGARRLRHGVIVRRRPESPLAAPSELDTGSAPAAKCSSLDAPLVRCPRCGTSISRRKRLRHFRRCKGAKIHGEVDTDSPYRRS